MSSSISNSDFRRYLFFLGLFSIPVLVVLFLNFLFLRNVGELYSVAEIVDLQQNKSDFCIYGDALRSVTYAYKMEAYRRLEPSVVILGSSRVLNFRERFFQKPFYNFGSTMTNVNEGLDMADVILHSPAKPDTVILGLDFWWFNESVTPPIAYRPTPKPLLQFEGYFLFKPFQWIKEGKITLGDYVQSIQHTQKSDACNIGIMAVKRRVGFGPDGSHYNTDTVTSPSDSGQTAFEEAADVQAGKGRFAFAAKAHPVPMENFVGLVDRLRSNGIDVIVVFPPFAPSVYAAMQEHIAQYGIFNDIKAHLRDAHIFFLDATDPSSINSSTCEFLDSVHGGDVAAARLLLKLDEERGRAGLPPLGNTNTLQKIAREDSGHAMAHDPRVTKASEIDFLNRGCPK